MNHMIKLIYLALLLPALLLAQPSTESTISTLQEMETLWQFSKEASSKYNPNMSYGGTMDEITKAYQDSLARYRELESKDLKHLNETMSQFEKDYGNSEKEIDANIIKSLGQAPKRRASFMWAAIKKVQNQLNTYPQVIAGQLLQASKRDLGMVKRLSAKIRDKKFDQIKSQLEIALEFDAKNTEAKQLLDQIDGLKSEEMAAVNKKIDEAKWLPHSAHFNGPGNPEKLTAAVEKFLEIDDEGQRHDSIIAVRISGDWRVADKTITGAPLTYGLPVHVAYRMKSDENTASVASFTMVTRDNEKQPPFKTQWVGDGWRVRVATIEATTGIDARSGSSEGSSGISQLFTLILSIALIISGLIAATPLLKEKVAAIGNVLDILAPLRGLVGVITFGIGSVFFILATLSLSPFANIIPQATAALIGLLLGLELMVKQNVHIDATENMNEAAQKAEQLANASAQKAQDLLKQNQDRIQKLQQFQIPIGVSAIVLGIVHLLMGNALLF